MRPDLAGAVMIRVEAGSMNKTFSKKQEASL